MTPVDPALTPFSRRQLREVRLFEGGRIAFDEVLRRIDEARSSIDMRAFMWRDDETGHQVARALLRAADRGVRVTITKDAIAAVYEYSAGSKQSFFHKRLDLLRRSQAWFLRVVYFNWGGVRQQPSDLAEAMLAHPNISVDFETPRYDHAKIFVFDESRIILGSFGIGNDHRFTWLEKVVELEGAHHVARLRARLSGEAEFDPRRSVDFLVHSRKLHPRGTCPMLAERLKLIDGARRSLVVEMAYLGDPRFTDALVRAVQRGVEVTVLTAAHADILGHLNRAVCDQLLRVTGAPANLKVFLYPEMVHTKVVVVDGRYCDIGSANFTRLSHGVYDEINVYLDDEAFAEQVAGTTLAHCAEAEPAGPRIDYNVLYFHVERAIEAFQGRHGG